jgi:hypothetical protein
MPGEMQWRSPLGPSTKILHLRMAPHEAWRPYTAFPQYAVPDYPMPGGSKGWATYQKLRLVGWTLVSSVEGTVNE